MCHRTPTKLHFSRTRRIGYRSPQNSLEHLCRPSSSFLALLTRSYNVALLNCVVINDDGDQSEDGDDDGDQNEDGDDDGNQNEDGDDDGHQNEDGDDFGVEKLVECVKAYMSYKHRGGRSKCAVYSSKW